MNTGASKTTHKHDHIHGVEKTVSIDTQAVIAKDAMLRTDNMITRQSFQGRFRKTVFGDFKGRAGRGTEHIEALMEDHEFEDKKAEAVREAAAVAEAAAANGVVTEPSNE